MAPRNRIFAFTQLKSQSCPSKALIRTVNSPLLGTSSLSPKRDCSPERVEACRICVPKTTVVRLERLEIKQHGQQNNSRTANLPSGTTGVFLLTC